MKILKPVAAVLLLPIVFSCSPSAEKPESKTGKYGPYSFRMYGERDAGTIARAHANFSITGPFSYATGDPWRSCATRDEFEARLKEFQAFTRECKKRGITVISYVSKTFVRPEDEGGLFDIWENRWEEYSDFFGEKPADHPRKWLAIQADGSLWGHTHIPPAEAATFVRPPTPRERAGCDLNPNFRRYLQGVVKLVCETGVDGIYLDHTENKCGYCDLCRQDFIKYLAANYPDGYFQKVYGVADLDRISVPTGRSDPLYREFRKWRAHTGAEFHRFLRDYARTLNPDFIMSGNAWSGNGFHAAIGSADMEMLGEVDDVPYSEIAVAGKFEEGVARVPHMEDGVRISNGPHYKHFRAMVGPDKPILVYPLYPESPNPVPREPALYPVVRLVIGECVAYGMTFRRVQPNHSPYVLLSAFDFYDFLDANQSRFSDQRLQADVAVLSSLNQFYSDFYSYFYSVSRALTDAGINHSMITEKSLNETELKRYRILILPFVPLMSDTQVKVIEDYVRDGGGLIVIGNCAAYDPFGLPRPEPALRSLIGAASGVLPASALQQEVGKGRVAVVPLPGNRMRQESIDYGLRYAWFSRGDFPGDLKAAWQSLPERVEWASGGGVVPLLRDPEGLEATLMKSLSGDRCLVHLLNYRVTIDGDVTPAANVLVTVPLDDGETVRSVKYLSPDADERELPFTIRTLRPGRRTVAMTVVPRLEIYGAVEFSLN